MIKIYLPILGCAHRMAAADLSEFPGFDVCISNELLQKVKVWNTIWESESVKIQLTADPNSPTRSRADLSAKSSSPYLERTLPLIASHRANFLSDLFQVSLHPTIQLIVASALGLEWWFLTLTVSQLLNLLQLIEAAFLIGIDFLSRSSRPLDNCGHSGPTLITPNQESESVKHSLRKWKSNTDHPQPRLVFVHSPQSLEASWCLW